LVLYVLVHFFAYSQTLYIKNIVYKYVTNTYRQKSSSIGMVLLFLKMHFYYHTTKCHNLYIFGHYYFPKRNIWLTFYMKLCARLSYQFTFATQLKLYPSLTPFCDNINPQFGKLNISLTISMYLCVGFTEQCTLLTFSNTVS